MPKIVDHDERRAHIVEALMRLIVRDGFERATMREIAAEAGYAHGAIARYFPDKQSVLTAAFQRLHTQANDRILAGVEGLRGLAALREMCLEILPFGEAGPRYAKVVLAFWDHAAQDREIWEIHREHNLRWRQLMHRFLGEARDDGELAEGIDIATAVNEVSARNAGWQMIAVLMPDEAGDAHLDQGLDALLDRFRARR
ncbi:TetR/AcrR family transcriptional regulator [Agromyces soli]|uniref:TetR/AcrR family transcriptional regulator n=1 Tax=Agromyces soli TaxID=659012 RepID=A0ABY4ASN7_9MICO|nr:TetR/AcrR family transcriptional regulator [Agromyces soli]UOE24873.1 TetR/AcrR family transcriptional regulator [Agromyces soli]